MLRSKTFKKFWYSVFIITLALGISTCNKKGSTTSPEIDPEPQPPEISSVAPQSGTIGTEITISGKNFSATASENAISFGGTEAAVQTASKNKLVTLVPQGAVSGPVKVTVNGMRVTGPDFTVETESPIIESISPKNGPVGMTVTIIGKHFSETVSDNIITFGDIAAPVQSASKTQLVTIVPDGATNGPVSVTVHGKTVIGPIFEVGENLPIIVSLSPQNGMIGTQVIITGSNFSATISENKITFNDTEATVIGASENELTTQVPQGATSGPVEVTVKGKTTVGPDFTVDKGSPKITMVSPKSGTVGTKVTISGHNFSATASENVITFNGTKAPVNSASDNELVTEVPVGATSGKIEVSVNGETAVGPDFTVGSNLPEITSLSPKSGTVGTRVTINGSNFSATEAENTVTFNGTKAIVISAEKTQLITEVPTGATTGPVEVTVNGEKAVGPHFTVGADIPEITSIVPESGTVGTTVTINGSNFSAITVENTITFNGTKAIVNSSSENQLVTKVPAGAASGPVEVTVNGKTTAGPNFTVEPFSPVITSVSPLTGTVGTEVTISGRNFSSTASKNKVSFNGSVAAVTSATEHELVTKVPSGATTGPIAVTVNGKTTAGPNFTVGVNLPEITSVSPKSGTVGTSVTISGSNFSATASENTITFNGTKASVVSAGKNQLVTLVPAGATTGPVSVTVNGKKAVGPSFTVGVDLPEITSISPESGTIGTTVTINGSNFSTAAAENTVTFNGTEAIVNSASSNQIVTKVPSGATNGPVEVTVNGKKAVGPNFTVESNSPIISSVSPQSGAVGTQVTIAGNNFSATVSDNTITFNGTNATVSSASKTQLVTSVPNEATTGSIVVTVNGKSVTGPAFTVTVNSPVITSVSPLSGTVGTPVTISGNNFSSTASENVVTFNGTNATVNSATKTQLVTSVPNSATTGPVAVAVNGKSATGPTFTVEPNPPVITSVSPLSGIVGATVTISGNNFSTTASENTITFNGTAASVSSASESQLVTEVPAGATSGPIAVTVSGKTDVGPNFTVEPNPPVISSVSPQSGSVGTQVTISGSNFSAITAENTVTFNGTEATVFNASKNQIITEVPVGASSGPVAVTVNGNTATGPDFEVIINMVQAIENDAELTTLANLIQNSDLATTLEGSGPYTILAPTDAAFNRLPAGFIDNLSPDELEDILSYHVIPADVDSSTFAASNKKQFETLQGDYIFTTVTVTEVVINFKAYVRSSYEVPNGRIIKVHNVLVPDAYLDVFEIIYKRYYTNKFACTCVSGRTGLKDVLKDVSTDYTLFVPNDDAFGKRPVSVDNLTDDELRYLMNYHIIENQVLLTTDFTNGQTITTRNGQTITISVAGDGTVSINGKSVLKTVNLEGVNGVVHVIDTVLEPPTGI